MLFPNLTLVIFVISFLVFMYLLNELFIKPVGETLEKRARLIAERNQAGKSCREEANALVEDYEKRLAKIREDAQTVITTAVNSAQAARNKEIGALKDKGRKRLDDSRAQLRTERAALLDSLVAEETELVKQIVGKLLKDSKVEVSSQNVKRALEEAV